MATKFPLQKAHPWHGISPGEECPQVVTAFIEIVPGDTIKYEIDKASGYLKVDRPQLYSNVAPLLYGFIPQTYCWNEVAKLANVEKGDGDPLDIVVLCERPISHGDIILKAIPVGGLRMIDKGEADDKIIAVLVGDAAYSYIKTIDDIPPMLLNRLRHYFMTYKLSPETGNTPVEIEAEYGAETAHEVIRASLRDYETLVMPGGTT
ncbi:MAG TPA: inorganic pyrophosphatase [Bacteroidia bacterium]|nr:inorganic pyrophosphatase [Bacteroidia bacterium]